MTRTSVTYQQEAGFSVDGRFCALLVAKGAGDSRQYTYQRRRLVRRASAEARTTHSPALQRWVRSIKIPIAVRTAGGCLILLLPSTVAASMLQSLRTRRRQRYNSQREARELVGRVTSATLCGHAREQFRKGASGESRRAADTVSGRRCSLCFRPLSLTTTFPPASATSTFTISLPSIATLTFSSASAAAFT